MFLASISYEVTLLCLRFSTKQTYRVYHMFFVEKHPREYSGISVLPFTLLPCRFLTMDRQLS
uniref:Uncharacterized protein n=1 Tax=Aegilops tauschii subsp. strangulata TaxID=200361 RepID=A0A452ZBH9_AEGTS